MTENAGNHRRVNPTPAIVIVVLAFVGVAAYCQTSNTKWMLGHDRYRVLPIREWRVGSGIWDGINHTGGYIYDYGLIERQTNVR